VTIESFGPGGFRVGGLWRPGSLLVLADVPQSWPPTAIAEVTMDDLVEFLLLGTGAAQALPPQPVRAAFAAARIGLEFMATEAAAREHNVLSGQGRLFATALIAI